MAGGEQALCSAQTGPARSGVDTKGLSGPGVPGGVSCILIEEKSIKQSW